MSGLSLPIIELARSYRAQWFRSDIPAGLAVAAVALPSAIAYPAIAGLAPETGLYASIFPLIAYAIFGSSRTLMVGPDAATMTVLAALLVAMPKGSDPVAVMTLLAMLVAGYCIAARLAGLGVIANFLSRPILVGFMSGVSLSILIGQIGRFTGLKIESDGLIPPFVELARKAGDIHWPSVVLAVAMLVLLQLLKRTRIPGPVAVVVLATALSALFDLGGQGIRLVGEIPAVLPELTLPRPGDLPLRELVLGAGAVFLVSFGAGIVTARSFGNLGKYEVDPNKELVGFAAANVGAGLFGGFPVTASDSRTAINLSAGGKSQVAGLVAAATLIAALLFLGGALALLPIPALGAILASAAIGLIDVASMRELWRISRMEFTFAMISMWGAISLGVLNGVIIAVAASLAYLLKKGMYPRDAMLGRVEGQEGFYALHRTPGARPVEGLAICILQGNLLFYNVDYVKTRLLHRAADQPAGTRWFILDASAIAYLDSSAAAMLAELHAALAGRGMRLGIAELHSDARGILERAGVIDIIGEVMLFDDLADVLAAFEGRPHQPASPR